MVSRKDQPMILLGLNQVEKAITSTMTRNRSAKSKVNRPRKNGRKQNGPARRSSAMGPMRPPAFKGLPQLQGQIRYIATAAFAGIFTQQDLFNCSGIIAQTAVLGGPVAAAIRLKKVSAWGPVQNAGTSVTVIVQDTSQDATSNNFTGLPILKEDSSLSFDRPAFVTESFPTSRPSGAWHLVGINSVAQDLFSMSGPLGTVVDIQYEWIQGGSALTNVPNPANFDQVLVGATPGDTYFRKAFSGNITPQGLVVL
jgi:hypothetical protein